MLRVPLGDMLLKRELFLFNIRIHAGDEMPDDNLEDYADKYDRRFQLAKRPRSLLARNSKPVVVEYQDEDGNWRSRIKMERIKFDDKAKGVFLEEYRKWGRMGESAAAAGVSTQCVRAHIESDQEFGNALMMAEEEYREKLIGHHQDLVFNGTQKENYDRNGALVSTETIYPIRLIELELKKHDSGYRDKQEVQVNHSGGVMVAPAEMASIDDWEKRFSKAKDITPSASIPVLVDRSEDDEDQ